MDPRQLKLDYFQIFAFSFQWLLANLKLWFHQIFLTFLVWSVLKFIFTFSAYWTAVYAPRVPNLNFLNFKRYYSDSFKVSSIEIFCGFSSISYLLLLYIIYWAFFCYKLAIEPWFTDGRIILDSCWSCLGYYFLGWGWHSAFSAGWAWF